MNECRFIFRLLSFLKHLSLDLLNHVEIINKHKSFLKNNKSVITAVKWFIYLNAPGCMFTHVRILCHNKLMKVDVTE